MCIYFNLSTKRFIKNFLHFFTEFIKKMALFKSLHFLTSFPTTTTMLYIWYIYIYMIRLYVNNFLYKTMLFTFLQKQKNFANKKRLTETMIVALQIPQEQKDLYLTCLKILNEQELNHLYNNLVSFVKEIEMEDIEEINQKNFSDIAGMRRKEAEEKKQEINSFSFLMHNL